MPTHVVIGRGATASATALLLAEAGARVRVISRSGIGPHHPNIEPVAADAAETDALVPLLAGARTVFNTAAPAYHTWPQEIPRLFGAILESAAKVGADLVMLGNLYGYGPADIPVTEDTPQAATGPKGAVRAAMWRDAAAAHHAGRLRVTEVRAGEFLGAGAISAFTLMVQGQVLTGRPALVPQALDPRHSYTAITDAAATLVAVSRDDRAWGRAWHAPVMNVTLREVATRLAELAGVAPPRLEVMTDREVALLALTEPFWGEVFETYHLSHREFVADASAVRETFGIEASSLDDVLRTVIPHI
ncbi:NAD-dependent epimerase/dehydratase family protein [Nocardia bovistercoris]|uniref:NAD-dependent epimerase n=1 Tax=Nocardia bovistercoris TaxID=2785916 RepID=A0A931I8I2_9NOCA|nr:NAD-dependent epimerase/dehydratase family protein [Nocardia bovistercoris]MBH0775697.1 NAD-dependent epimerase [Nocardia bovistercoris]